MNFKYDAIVFIGRFQPFHSPHALILDQAFTLADHVFITIGSSFKARTYKNPFTHFERRNVIRQYLERKKVNLSRYSFIYSEDSLSNDEWADRIFNAVKFRYQSLKFKISLIGHKKDSSSFYLDMFPTWDFIEVESLCAGFSAIDIREHYFAKPSIILPNVPIETHQFLEDFTKFSHFETICSEREQEESYKTNYKHLPYPPTFVTADAVVQCNGEFLIITRKTAPGKGLYALPGGFLNANDDPSVEDAMIRELEEETGLIISKSDIIDSKVFDSIGRSSRGRTITHAFYVELARKPTVVASDDAENTIWLDWESIWNQRDQFFEDHYLILRHFNFKHLE
jgi:bifunctional NMN adenylyltransferase/nudix hydrolase